METRYCCLTCGERYSIHAGQPIKCPVCSSKEREEISSENQVEKVAAFMHDTWSHWTQHMLTKLCYGPRDNTADPIEAKPRLNGNDWAGEARSCIDRWRRQSVTKYKDLSEDEKKSDREIAERLLALIEEE